MANHGASVLLHFGKGVSIARKKYAEFVEKGIVHGRRDDLTGGGLIRSAGGWKELEAMRSLNIRLQSDERILGDSDFVEGVLKEAEEALDRKQQYLLDGFGFDQVLRLLSSYTT